MKFTDQLGREIELRDFPKRIISLVPSQTELLADLGLEEEVVGITRFCIHPEKWFYSKTRIGGTKQINFEKINSLQPDLIIGNKEENEQEQILELMKTHTVWMSDIKNLSDATQMIRNIGAITNRNSEAEKIAKNISVKFSEFRIQNSEFAKRNVAYFIWKNPWMVAGHDTFINHLLEICKWENIFLNASSRYPEITLEELKTANPEIIFLSSEPYPFKQKHIEELKIICPDAKIMLVDGELFSWYGSRLLKSPEYFIFLRDYLSK